MSAPAAALIRSLRAKGVQLTTDGYKVRFNPPAYVMDHERAALREHKAGVISVLMEDERAQADLLDRLNVGAAFITRELDALLGEAGDAPDAQDRWGRLCAAQDKWQSLEALARFVYGLQGHIGPGDRCPADGYECQSCAITTSPVESPALVGAA